MVAKGTAGPPPSSDAAKAARQSGAGGRKPYRYAFYEAIHGLGPKRKRRTLRPFSLDKGEKGVPLLFLDEAHPDDGSDPSYRIHEIFKFNGTYGHFLVCLEHETTGCLMDIALQQPHKHAHWCKKEGPDACTREGQMEPRKGGWRWIGTVLRLTDYTFEGEKSPDKGVRFPCQRMPVFVPEVQFEKLMNYRKAFKGLRGRLFIANRGEGQRSAKIGEWDPADEVEWEGITLKSPMTDEDMVKVFADAAKLYGLTPEEFVRPIDYEKSLKVFTVAEMNRAAHFVAEELGVDLDAEMGSQPVSASAPDVQDDEEGPPEEADDTIPF